VGTNTISGSVTNYIKSSGDPRTSTGSTLGPIAHNDFTAGGKQGAIMKMSTPVGDTIKLHYQPVIERGGAVVGLEALMRWHHRQRGSISPEAFIPIFEDSGLIVPLSRWALTQACHDAATWNHSLVVAVNLSPRQFFEEDLAQLVSNVLAETGLPAERLELDLTGAALIHDPECALSILSTLSRAGVHLALDDFGIGRTSQTDLTRYPFSKVKIDTSIIAHLEESSSARRLVAMITELGHSLGLVVAAEGVETETQLQYLRAQGCDVMQGFLLGRPGPVEDFTAYTGRAVSGAAAVLDGWQQNFEQTAGYR
jgi:EAL domain-containing protein (putative c-di-GMP-specific phosphodiesterase class I)